MSSGKGRMKLFLIIIVTILVQKNLYGIERYTKGDILFNWSIKLNLRESPNINSKALAQIGIGEKVVANQNKYSKEEDVRINKITKNWEKALTGNWVEVIYKNQIGYAFDAYLSKYDKDRILNDEIFEQKDTLRIPEFESFYRLKKEGGILKEIGIGMEWGKIVYYVPDFSIEEAIYLIKEQVIDNKFGNRKWEFDLENTKIEMKEDDGISYLSLRIKRIENLCIITIEDWV